MTAQMPKEIDRYEVLRALGAGAMGAVYEARHKGTGRRVAVKLIKPEVAEGPDIVQRFQREARAAGAIASDHITQVFDSGTDPATGAPFLVMELLRGEDLHTTAHRLGPMRPDLALRIVAQALLGLERAHAAKVIHRDIKPPNLFLAQRDDGTYVVKLCDFGIAKVGPDALSSSQNASLTHTSALLGSPNYMSPEQAKGSKKIDSRTDLWSMGVVLYELLVGQTPYPEADTLGLILLAICSNPPADVQAHSPWVPPEVAAIVKRAMTSALPKRYQTAREMLDAVLDLTGGETRIDASMLVPMSEDELLTVATPLEKSEVAPFAETVAMPTPAAGHGAPRSAPTSGGPSAADAIPTLPEGAGARAASGAGEGSATANAYTRSQASRAPKRSVRTAVAFVALAALGVGGALYARRAPSSTDDAGHDPSGVASVVPSGAPVVVGGGAVPPAVAPLEPSASAPTPSASAPAAPSVSATVAPSKTKGSPHPTAHPTSSASPATAASSASSHPPKKPPATPAASSSSSPLSREFN